MRDKARLSKSLRLLQNILLTEKGDSAALKIIDFGTSAFCLPGQKLYHKVGTPYYVAPEVTPCLFPPQHLACQVFLAVFVFPAKC